MITTALDFTGCEEKEDFYDRIIEALGIGGYCGTNRSADDIARVAEIMPYNTKTVADFRHRYFLRFII